MESIPGLHKSLKITASVRFTSIQLVFLASILPICGISRFRFDLFKFLNKQSSIRFDLSTVWNKQSSLRFDLSYIWNKQRSLGFDLFKFLNKQSLLRFVF